MTRVAAAGVVLAAALAVAIPRAAEAQQVIGGCLVLPANNIWNTPIDTLPVLSNSSSMVTTIGASTGFHADFGAGLWDGGPIGIPFITVAGSQTKYPATFLYADESDSGPYAVPLNAPIEGGSSSSGDRHAIAIDTTNCILYELYDAYPQASSWNADSGAIYDLKSNALRPAGWTSADAAGLPIMPGLITYDEVQSGEIKHAIRFTVPQSRRAYVWPARHYASSLTGTQYPRMGERFRLKATFDISSYPADVQVILRAMKKYGIILADNGSAWYISGEPDDRWNNTNLHTLGNLLGSNFEAVDASSLMIDPNSGAAVQNGVTVSVSPASATVRAGRTQTFTGTVTGASGGVMWAVNGIAGGNTGVGQIDTTGKYFAPLTPPSPPTVTVQRDEHRLSWLVGQRSRDGHPLAWHHDSQPVVLPGRQLHAHHHRRRVRHRLYRVLRRRGDLVHLRVVDVDASHRQRSGGEVFGARDRQLSRRDHIQHRVRDGDGRDAGIGLDFADERKRASEADEAIHRDGPEHHEQDSDVEGERDCRRQWQPRHDQRVGLLQGAQLGPQPGGGHGERDLGGGYVEVGLGGSDDYAPLRRQDQSRNRTRPFWSS